MRKLTHCYHVITQPRGHIFYNPCRLIYLKRKDHHCRYTLTRADQKGSAGSAEKVSSRFRTLPSEEEAAPLAFVFGWAGASARNLDKYARIYRRAGCHTFSYFLPTRFAGCPIWLCTFQLSIPFHQHVIHSHIGHHVHDQIQVKISQSYLGT